MINNPPLNRDRLFIAYKNLLKELNAGSDSVSCAAESRGKGWQIICVCRRKEEPTHKQETRSIRVVDGGDITLQVLQDKEKQEIMQFVVELCARYNYHPSKAYEYGGDGSLTYYLKPMYQKFHL